MSCTNVSTTIPPTKNHQLREFSLREPISRCFLHCVTNRRAYDDSARKMEQHRKLKKNRLQPSFGQTTVKVKVVLLHPGAQKVLWTNSMFFLHRNPWILQALTKFVTESWSVSWKWQIRMVRCCCCCSIGTNPLKITLTAGMEGSREWIPVGDGGGDDDYDGDGDDMMVMLIMMVMVMI